MNSRTIYNVVAVTLIAIFLAVLIRNAWIGDDAYITFRTVDNFVNGYGLRWNVGERVQSYTNPLWMLTLSLLYLFTRELFLTSLILSMVLSITAVSLLSFKIASAKSSALLILLILILSKAFVDYSACGLENPLSFLILAWFFYVYSRCEFTPRILVILSLIAALGALTRLDVILLFVPALGYAWWQVRTVRAALAILAGFVPLVIWELFSLFYYGFPFPNTAYAKLNTGIPASDLFAQGGYYFWYSLKEDPLTIVGILVGIVTPFFLKSRRLLPISAGIVLYLIYILKIGGDFMIGRFFAVPILVAVCLISQLDLALIHRWRYLPYVAVLIMGLTSDNCPVLSGSDYGRQNKFPHEMVTQRGIVDERAVYYQKFGLLHYPPEAHAPAPFNPLKVSGVKLIGQSIAEAGMIGYLGFAAGPDLHIFDIMGLSEPLLARLPLPGLKSWRIGHFRRVSPDGYIKSLDTGENMIKDSTLAEYWDKLALVTRGDLFSLKRLREIVKFNIGTYDHLIYNYVYGPIREVDLTDLYVEANNIDEWNERDIVTIPFWGLRINLKDRSYAKKIEIFLEASDAYRIVYFGGEDEVGQQIVPSLPSYCIVEQLATYQLEIPEAASTSGFDRIEILPIHGDGRYRGGHVRPLEE